MEAETRRFYEKAAGRAHDARLRQLLDDLAQEERSHEVRAEGPDDRRAGKSRRNAAPGPAQVEGDRSVNLLQAERRVMRSNGFGRFGLLEFSHEAG
jgi:hypothetical protein